MAADVLIIGAGVVGCATARRFALAGARVVLVEKGADILSGASKANSAILHTGFDAPADSLELACMKAGYQEYLEIRERFNLPLVETGAMVVAWNADEVAALDGIEEKAFENGVGDVSRLNASGIRTREPHLSPQALEAVLVPGEHLIDPWSPFLAYMIQAKALGAEFHFQTEVTGGTFDGETWAVETSRGTFSARAVINCAGLQGDRIEALLLGGAHFSIHPRKGQFVVFDKAAASLLKTTILPVPTERTKGVVLCQTAFGNVLVGPTAEEQEDRTRATTDEAVSRRLVEKAASIVPALADMPVTAIYAGLRPASDKKHYRIRVETDRQWITIGGIRSTGLTASLGIAAYALSLYEKMLEDGTRRLKPVENPPHAPVRNLAEPFPRDFAAAGNGGIVCHCELVTAREIAEALSGPLPAGDYGGLRRRTRCGMGRCQGFNCQAHIARLSAGKLRVPMIENERVA
nr:NAD(P)/FAD-dependent oxidoreductase [uncultured Gellertiella sp.]